MEKPRKRRHVRPWLISAEGFRELRLSCFLSQQACAEFLGVTLRTVRHWDAGRNRVPWSAVRLLRLRRTGDLGALDAAWAGWSINRNGLWSPDGRQFRTEWMQRWWITLEQARFWRDAYDRWTLRGVGVEPPRGREAVTPLTTAAAEATAIGMRPVSFNAAFALPATPSTAFLVVGWAVGADAPPVQPLGAAGASVPAAGTRGEMVSAVAGTHRPGADAVGAGMLIKACSGLSPTQLQQLQSHHGGKMTPSSDHFSGYEAVRVHHTGPVSNTGLCDKDGA